MDLSKSKAKQKYLIQRQFWIDTEKRGKELRVNEDLQGEINFPKSQTSNLNEKPII